MATPLPVPNQSNRLPRMPIQIRKRTHIHPMLRAMPRHRKRIRLSTRRHSLRLDRVHAFFILGGQRVDALGGGVCVNDVGVVGAHEGLEAGVGVDHEADVGVVGAGESEGEGFGVGVGGDEVEVEGFEELLGGGDVFGGERDEKGGGTRHDGGVNCNNV